MKLNYGKTIYTFMYGGDPVRVNNIVQAWLTANGFSLVSDFVKLITITMMHGTETDAFSIRSTVMF